MPLESTYDPTMNLGCSDTTCCAQVTLLAPSAFFWATTNLRNPIDAVEKYPHAKNREIREKIS